ncbi:MAG: glycosyltransferase family 2 protein [Saprospiraceae bacterium]|nr:glycosyltransferase family 2 protein [Saprospiraceae bacterium]
MFEDVLKYLQPTHYFQRMTNEGRSVFPTIEVLPDDIISQLKRDQRFDSILAQSYDMSWQAIQKGYVGNVKTYSNFEKLSVKDNYHFARKYFSSIWVFYVLCLRILGFHNPVKEIRAWLKTRATKRDIFINKPLKNEWINFHSQLIKTNPKVSVIIPTLNRYHVLKDVLKDLEHQDYSNFEVIIVDQSEPFQKDYYTDFMLDIKLIRQEEKALWLARNTAIKNASGELIALSEDDVRIQSDWITEHIKCLDFHDSKVSAGVFHPEGQTIPRDRSFFKIASQFATGNAMFYKDILKIVGLFDRQFEKQRMGDGEFGLRLYLNGIKSISNPYAACVDVKAPTGGLRFMGSWDAFRPTSLFAARPVPSVLYYFRRYFGNKNARFALLRTVPLSIMPYRFKKNKPLLIVGVFVTIVLLPLVGIQVMKSWRLSSRKLRQGPLIEQLN